MKLNKPAWGKVIIDGSEKLLMVDHHAQRPHMDIVERFTPRESPFLVDICGFEAAVGRRGVFWLDRVDVDPENVALRMLIRKVYCPYSSSCFQTRVSEEGFITRALPSCEKAEQPKAPRPAVWASSFDRTGAHVI